MPMRLDMRGYPGALTATGISPLGQQLALAELIPPLFSRKRIIPLAEQEEIRGLMERIEEADPATARSRVSAG